MKHVYDAFGKVSDEFLADNSPALATEVRRVISKYIAHMMSMGYDAESVSNQVKAYSDISKALVGSHASVLSNQEGLSPEKAAEKILKQIGDETWLNY